MSENNESHQAQAGAQAPRVARSASSQPLSGTEQSQAHENMAAASGGVKVREKARRGAPRARRMSLSLTRIDAWSAAKVAFMLSIAGGIIQIVAVTAAVAAAERGRRVRSGDADRVLHRS